MNSEINLYRGRLKNGNPVGDFTKAPRCGARNRPGNPCQCPAIRGKRRCRLHGGRSTGPRTSEGLWRIRKAHWKDGSRSVRLQQELRAWQHQKQISIKGRIATSKEPPRDWIDVEPKGDGVN